jgi:hypothetical protein
MANLLQSYIEKEKLLQKLQDELKSLESDERLHRELEFKQKLEELMNEYEKSARDVLVLLDAHSDKNTGQNTPSRRKRKLKIYKNPNTGETIETRGGNHKTLKAWKDEHGEETVESWLVRTEA